MVSYHGTDENAMDNIAEEGFQEKFGKRFAYGKGIYSTPDVSVAECYAKTFIHENT